MTQSEFRLLLLRFALLPMLFLAAFVALISLQIHQITLTRSEGLRATSLLLQAGQLLSGLVDEETGIRGYLATGESTFLEPYQDTAARLQGDLDTLAKTAGTDQALLTQIAGIRADFDRFDLINRQILQSATARENPSPLLFRQKEAMDSLRHRLSELIRVQSASRITARQRVTELFDRLPLLAIISGAFVTLCVVLYGIHQFQRISRAFGRQIAEVEIQRNSLQTTLHSIGDAVIVCDAKGVITLFNPTAEAVTGWKIAEALGMPLSNIFRIVNEYTRQPVESPVDKVLRTGQIVGLANHTVLIRHDSSEVAIDDSGAPIHDDTGAIVGVVLVFRDIQARRIAERELALRNAELESLFENSPAGFATFNREHRLVRVNAALALMDGIPVADHLGRSVSELVPQSAPIFSEILDTLFNEGKPIQREFTGAPPQEPETERQWLMWFYPIFAGDAREPLLAGVIVLDTTARWHAQEALVRNEKLVAVGRLAASIAHEMNNPLTSVTNLLYLIGCDTTLNETTRGYVERASIELDRVSRMATQTLRFARRSMAPAFVDLEEVIQGILLLFSGRLSHAMIAVARRRRKASIFHGYASEVVQVLSNLVSNAIDAVGASGRITIALQNGRNWQTGERCIAVTVADSGPGIPEPIQRKIWEPFFTTKAETGTGLGLWLVDETVRKNGGSIHLRTAVGAHRHGTVFRVLLPLDAGKSTAPADTAHSL
jgi:PAS domain S-box-containing protein